MGWSIGEARSVAVKAARGIGMPWGLAEEAGFAIEWLEVRNADGLQALANYLQTIDHSQSYQMEFCPIALGASISDSGYWTDHSRLKTFQPILLVPFLGNVAGNEILELKWKEGAVVFNSASVHVDVSDDLAGDTVSECTIDVTGANLPISQCTGRVPTDRRQWIDSLNKLAALTYAPATEQSRLSGAGAGTSDND